jgi:hypothetical protein
VQTNQAGTITQRAIRRGTKTTTALCTTRRQVSAAGTHRLTCTMGAKIRNQPRTRAIRYTLVTTFTTAAGKTATVRVEGRITPKVAAVTRWHSSR